VLPDIDISASPDHAKVLIGDSVTINILSNAAAGSITYTWFPTSGLSCSDCPVSVVSPDVDTRYVVIGIDTNGCRDTTLVPIFVTPPVILFRMCLRQTVMVPTISLKFSETLHRFVI